MSRALSRLFDAIGIGGASAADLTALGIVMIGATACPFLPAIAAVAIAGLAGRRVLSDFKHDNDTEQIAGALDFLIGKDGQRNRSLQTLLEEALRNKDLEFLKRLPTGLTGEPLADFLAILHAEGQQRDELLEEHDKALAGVRLLINENFEAIRESLDLTREDLLSLRNDIRSTSRDVAALLRLNRVAPPIWIPSIPLEDATRFRFDARCVVMRGRQTELAELDAFLQPRSDGRMFAWWLWTGEAGMGKSRLALELCHKHWAEWTVGFLDWQTEHFNKWDVWTPDAPTLIVIDYVARFVEEIRNAIEIMTTRTLEYPVRFLLLERPIPRASDWEQSANDGSRSFSFSLSGGTWWDQLCPGNEDSITLWQHNKTRHLDGLSPDIATQVLAELARVADIAADVETLDRWQSMILAVDPRCRPLLLAMGFEAIHDAPNHADVASWSIDTLVQHIIIRERDHRWRHLLQPLDTENAQKYLNLLLFAALCPGLTINSPAFDNASLREILPTRLHYGDGSTYAQLVPEADGTHIPALEPDLLAECLIVVEMEKETERHRRLIDAAWRRHSISLGYGLLPRLVVSFPQSSVIDHLFRAAPADFLSAALIRLHFQRGFSLFSRGLYGPAGDSLTAVIEMVDASSEPRAQALVNRGIAFGQRGGEGDLELALADCTAVLEMVDASSEQRAKALVIRGFAFGKRGGEGDLDRALANYTAVIKMPDAPAEERAQALNYRGVTYGQRGGEGDLERELADYTAVIEMVDAPAEHRARALVNRGVTFVQRGGEGDLERALADSTTVIEMHGAPAVVRRMAQQLINQLRR